MRFNIHHFHHPDEATAEQLCRIERMLGDILEKQETIMIDTSKLLAAVARETTANASLRALVAANTQVQADSAAKLKTAIDALAAAGADTAALAQVQADLDTATKNLSVDSDQSEAALAANVAPAPAPTQ